jgi:tetratricopeptide (TPR) repeat protein
LAFSYTDLRGSREALERSREEATALDRDDLRLQAELELASVGVVTEDDVAGDATVDLGRRAVEVLRRSADDEGVARAWMVVATGFWVVGRWDDLLEPLERSVEYARRAGRRSMEHDALRLTLAAAIFSSMTVEDGLRVARSVLAETAHSHELQGWALRVIGTLVALEGRVDEGRQLLEQARSIFTELGYKLALAALAFSTGPLELREGEPAAAERDFRQALGLVQDLDERGHQTNLAAGVAEALIDQGRLDDAEHYANVAREAALQGDTSAQAAWRMVSARVLVRRGSADEAVGFAREALALIGGTSELYTLSPMLVNAAEVLQLAGREEEAAEALRQSIDVAQRKGALADVRFASERLAAIKRAEPAPR